MSLSSGECYSRYLDYVDSTFTADGLIPTLEQAEQLFLDKTSDNSMSSFNESRASLGMGKCQSASRQDNGKDEMILVSQPSIGDENSSFGTREYFLGSQAPSRKEAAPRSSPSPLIKSRRSSHRSGGDIRTPRLRSKCAGLVVLPSENVSFV